MKSKTILIVSILMTLSTLSLISCKKDASYKADQLSDEESMTISEENLSADAEYDDITEIGLSAGADLETADLSNEQAATNSTESTMGVRLDLFPELRFKTGPCTSLEIAPFGAAYPKTVTINYGEGCLCKDGRFRKGSIVLVFSAPIRKPGATVSISLVDYYVNKAHIEGTKTITNLGGNGAIKYSVKIENGKLAFPNGRGFTYDAEKTVTQTEGMDSWTIRDDAYEIEGNSHTAYANGWTVTKNTEAALLRRISCGWLVKGKIKIAINDRIFYVDFGSGNCDNKAVISWPNGEKEITLL
jgi:hypothetical protein